MSPRVLVCEDNRAIRDLITMVLRRSGMAVDSVGSGTECLASVNAFTYDAIVLDLLLPGTTGAEIIDHFRSTRPAVLRRTVVATASANDAKTLRELSDLAAVVVKPFDLDDLVGAVTRAANRSDSDA